MVGGIRAQETGQTAGGRIIGLDNQDDDVDDGDDDDDDDVDNDNENVEPKRWDGGISAIANWRMHRREPGAALGHSNVNNIVIMFVMMIW